MNLRQPCGPLAPWVLALVALLLWPGMACAAGTVPAGEVSDLRAQVDQKIAGFDGEVGLYVQHLESGQVLEEKADTIFPLNSIFKLPVVMEMFRQNSVGATSITRRVNLTDKDLRPGKGVLQYLDIDLKPTVRDLAVLSIIADDNQAVDKLLEAVGIENVGRLMNDEGLNITINADTRTLADTFRQRLVDAMDLNTRLELKVVTPADLNDSMITDALKLKAGLLMGNEPLNVGTPKAVASLLEKLSTRQIISPEDCDRILEMLTQQQSGSCIPRYLPTTTRVAHLPGEMPSMVNDAGIITLPDNSHLILVVLTRGSHKPAWVAEDLIAQISKLVYNHYTAK